MECVLSLFQILIRTLAPVPKEIQRQTKLFQMLNVLQNFLEDQGKCSNLPSFNTEQGKLKLNRLACKHIHSNILFTEISWNGKSSLLVK